MKADESRLPELETAPKRNIILETAPLVSLSVAVLSLFLFEGGSQMASRTTGRLALILPYGTRFMPMPLPL